MSDPSNQGLTLLRTILDRLDNPAGSVAAVPLTTPAPFFRMGEPFIIPVSPSSAANPFAIAIPENATTFQWVNNNPFAVRLRGIQAGKNFIPVTSMTGWLWMPGTQGIRTSLGPAFVSVMSVDGPYAASDDRQKAGIGFVELQYGTGY